MNKYGFEWVSHGPRAASIRPILHSIPRDYDTRIQALTTLLPLARQVPLLEVVAVGKSENANKKDRNVGGGFHDAA